MNKDNSAFDRILCPLDGSREGEAALPYVETMAKKTKAEVVLLQVVVPQYEIALAEGYTPTVVNLSKEYIEHVSAAARKYLNTVKDRLDKSKIMISCEVEVGSPAQKIVDYAAENNINLIAMSTHGRSGIGRWLIGSVSDKVLHATDIPVLMVRATKTSEEEQ